MQIGALGDVHGAFDAVTDIISRHPDVALWVQVGDVASNDGEYFTPAAPIYWIKGNNEDFDIIARAMAGEPPASTLHYLPNGGPHQVGPWRVAASDRWGCRLSDEMVRSIPSCQILRTARAFLSRASLLST